jgi:hypothetical protein
MGSATLSTFTHDYKESNASQFGPRFQSIGKSKNPVYSYRPFVGLRTLVYLQRYLLVALILIFLISSCYILTSNVA